jgi:hypothetical protein
MFCLFLQTKRNSLIHSWLVRICVIVLLTMIGCIYPATIMAQCTPTSATLNFVDDDGATFYINGTKLSSCIANTWSGGTNTCWLTPTTYNFTAADLNKLVAGQNVLGVDLADLGKNNSGVVWDLLIKYSCCPSQEIISDGTNTRFLDIGAFNQATTTAPTPPAGWTTIGYNDAAWPVNFYNSTNLPAWSSWYPLFTTGIVKIPWMGPVSFVGNLEEFLYRQTFTLGGNGNCSSTATPGPTMAIQKSILGPTTGVTSGQLVTYIVKTCNSGGALTTPVTVSEGL